MSGALIGVFDPGTRLDGSRLPEGAVQLGPLRISSNTPPLIAGTTLCVLEGVLDNGGALAEQLGCGPLSSEGLLVAGYQRWGRGLLTRLRGDFSLLLWDEQRGEGLLARDQMGVRSVFLCDGPGGTYFASEIHNLLALLPSRPAPDPVGVAHWVAVSPRPGAGTLYSGIRRLSPGSALFMDRHRAREEPYWRPRYVEPLEATTEHELTEQVRHALAMGVGRRIDQRSPTGVLMSGGLDSASVAALAAQSAHGRVLAYSGTFPEHPAVDEAPSSCRS
jgi:asparagine synthase (glutamine-hydrolysing)